MKLFNGYAEVMTEEISHFLQGRVIKVLIPKQMLQRLPITFAQEKLVIFQKNNKQN